MCINSQKQNVKKYAIFKSNSLPFGFTSKPKKVQVCKATKIGPNPIPPIPPLSSMQIRATRWVGHFLWDWCNAECSPQNFHQVFHQHQQLRSANLTSTHLLFIPQILFSETVLIQFWANLLILIPLRKPPHSNYESVEERWRGLMS